MAVEREVPFQYSTFSTISDGDLGLGFSSLVLTTRTNGRFLQVRSTLIEHNDDMEIFEVTSCVVISCTHMHEYWVVPES